MDHRRKWRKTDLENISPPIRARLDSEIVDFPFGFRLLAGSAAASFPVSCRVHLLLPLSLSEEAAGGGLCLIVPSSSSTLILLLFPSPPPPPFLLLFTTSPILIQNQAPSSLFRRPLSLGLFAEMRRTEGKEGGIFLLVVVVVVVVPFWPFSNLSQGSVGRQDNPLPAPLFPLLWRNVPLPLRPRMSSHTSLEEKRKRHEGVNVKFLACGLDVLYCILEKRRIGEIEEEI